MDVPVAANVLGTIGAVCWSIQLIPQIIINYRRHNTIGLQRSMMLLWACAGIPLGAYNVTGNFNVALLVQPQILTLLSLITWIQCFYYDDKWSVGKCCAVVSLMGVLMGGIEVGLIFALKDAIQRDRHWAVTLLGVVSAVLLCAGVLRHYWDIYVHRTVRGISFIFVGIDAAGDIFSLISVFFQPRLDVLGMIIYASEFVLWAGVFACGGYFNLRPWAKQKLKAKGQRKENARSNALRGQAIDERHSAGTAHDITLHHMPSSTSVFRTPSSINTPRNSATSSVR